MREDVRIPCRGEQLAAYLYRPDATHGPAPCVVMANGFSGTRDDGLPRFAEAFRAAGFVVVLFDYRYFGASTGEPRQLLDIGRQQDDYRAAIAWARQLDGVDPDRIVLWGWSFSGGHVLALAAGDPQVAAVISQSPNADSIASLMLVSPKNLVRMLGLGLLDQIGAWFSRPPLLVPATADPGEFGALTAPEAMPGFRSIVGPESRWRNAFAARLALRLAFYRPGRKASRLRMPLWVGVCEQDATTPVAPAVKAAKRASRADLRRYPYGHFDIFDDPQAIADHVEFLQRTVQGIAA